MNETEEKEKTDILKRMSGVVSHELRNPLAIIANSAYFVKAKLGAGGAPVDPKVLKHLGIIDGEVKHSNEVIEAMLAFSRPRELNLTQVALNGAARDLAASYALPANVTLKVEIDPADPCADADAEALDYALRCLVNNAVQAMPEGGAVTLAVASGGGQARFVVTDSGPGLPPGDLAKVFEPFHTTKPRGLGLGLAIARKFLALHGGTAAAENAPGGGARCTLTLPLKK